MRYADAVKNHVRELRHSGLGLNQISSKVKIPKSTIRLWIADIELTSQQKDYLKNKAINALQKGRINSQKIKSKKRSDLISDLHKVGVSEVGKLSKREILIAGIALYWAEGFKNRHEKRLGFCNSDPTMVLFYLKWLGELGITKENVTVRVSLNVSYQDREPEIRKYWANLTDIPLDNFTKTFYQNSIWKKQAVDSNYKGVLRIHVKESLQHLLKMRGWIEGIKLNA